MDQTVQVQALTDSDQQNSEPLMESVEQIQTAENGPSMVQESVNDIKSNNLDSGDSQASREELLQQIELLQAQLKEQKAELVTKDYEINRHKSASRCVRTMKNNMKEWQKEVDASNAKVKALEMDLCDEKKLNAEAWKKMSNLEGEINGLHKEVKILKADLNVKNMALEDAQSTVKALEDEALDGFSLLQGEIAGWEAERDELRSQVSSQTCLLREKTLETQEAVSQLKIFEEERAALESTLHYKDTPLEEMAFLREDRVRVICEKCNLKIALHSTNTSLEEAQKKAEVQEVENAKLKAENDCLSLRVESLQSTIIEKVKALIEEQSKVQNMDAEMAGLRAERSDMSLQVGNLNSVLLEKNTALGEAQRKVEVQEEENATLQAKCNDLCLQVGSTSSALFEKNTALAEAENKVKDLVSKMAGLERDRHALSLQVGHLKSEVREKNSALGQAQRNVQTHEEEKVKLQGESYSLGLRVSQAERKVFVKTKALEEEQCKVKDLTEKMAKLRAEKNGLSLSMASRERLLLVKNSALAEESRKVNNMKEKMAELRAERNGLSVQLENQTSALRAKDAALAEDRSTVKTLETEKCELQSSEKHLHAALQKQKKDTDDACFKVTELERELRKQKAVAQAFEQSLKTTQDTFKTIAEQCRAKFSAVLAEKRNMEEKVQDLSQEIEHLNFVHDAEVSLLQSSEGERRVALQRTMQELSDALKTSQENNSDLLTHKHELQEMIRIKDDQIQEMENRRKQKKRWFR